MSAKTTTTTERRSFVITDSVFAEIVCQLKIAIPIAIGNVCQILPQIVANIFIGHLPNAVRLLSGVNLARTFCNVTATSIAWGFSSALYTLIPSAIGANDHGALTVYIQRAIAIDFVLFIPLTIIQCFGGSIMQSMYEPGDLISIVTIYCRLLLPFLYFNTLNTAIKRVSQSCNYNMELLLIQIACGILSWPLNIFFVHYLQYGYIGTALTLNVTTFLQFLCTLLLTLRIQNYKFISMFVPLPLTRVISKDGIIEYLRLSIPGLFQYSLEWWIIEICIVLSGYVAHAQTALSASAIIANLVVISISICLGIAAAGTYRVGKYMGAQMVPQAKLAAKCNLGIAFAISALVFVVLYFSNASLVRLWTDDARIVSLVGIDLIYVVVAQQFAIALYQALGGIYRGVGYQKISALCVIFSYYLVAMPLVLILLFGCQFDESTSASLLAIWMSVAVGNGLAALLLLLHCTKWLDWESAKQATLKRIQSNNCNADAVAAVDNGTVQRKNKEHTSLVQSKEDDHKRCSYGSTIGQDKQTTLASLS